MPLVVVGNAHHWDHLATQNQQADNLFFSADNADSHHNSAAPEFARQFLPPMMDTLLDSIKFFFCVI